MTIADEFAQEFRGDGQCWRTFDGQSWDDVARRMEAHFEYSSSRDKVRLTFPDGSVITAVGEGWDHGFPGCWCWAGSPRDGHENGRCGAGED